MKNTKPAIVVLWFEVNINLSFYEDIERSTSPLKSSDAKCQSVEVSFEGMQSHLSL